MKLIPMSSILLETFKKIKIMEEFTAKTEVPLLRDSTTFFFVVK